jgi:hypothetical protein
MYQAAKGNGKLCCLHCWRGLGRFYAFYETFYLLIRAQTSSFYQINLLLFFSRMKKGGGLRKGNQGYLSFAEEIRQTLLW